MDRLKSTLLGIKNQNSEDDAIVDRIEVLGLSISSCLEQAAAHWDTDLTALDYKILEKGKKSFFKSKPYRLQVQLLRAEQDLAGLEEFSMKLGVGDRLLEPSLQKKMSPLSKDGRTVIRNYFNGTFLFVFPAIANGKNLSLDEVIRHIEKSGVEDYDGSIVTKAIHDRSAKPVKIASFQPNSESNSTCKLKISSDQMSASIYLTPPEDNGCHLQASNVAAMLVENNIVVGFQEEKVEQALLEDNCYFKDIVVARGIAPKHGLNARIDFKVNINKNTLNLREDEAGRIDFKNLSLIENVVVGQILAEKIPKKKGKTGYTIFNRVVEAKEGKDIEFKRGSGTLLVENKTQLIAEINGQVVTSRDRVTVKPVYRILGNVGPKTGNINFLGSVIVGGSVLNEFKITASGNVEIQGSTQQRSCIEADGDVIVRSGVQGSQIHSSGGNVIVTYIQDSQISAAQDVISSDGILRSNVDAGNMIVCNGRRAQIIGGRLRAKNEVWALTLGSRAHTTTDVTVGVDPDIISKYEHVNEFLAELKQKIDQTQKLVASLEKRAKNLTSEQEKTLSRYREEILQWEAKKQELSEEQQELNAYFEVQTSKARVHVARKIFPRVTVNILKAQQEIREIYNSVTLAYDQGYIKIDKLERKQDTKNMSKLRIGR